MLERTNLPESRPANASIPVATSGAIGIIQGTACFCMFDPISARVPSSCSKNGIIDVANEKAWFGATST